MNNIDLTAIKETLDTTVDVLNSKKHDADMGIISMIRDGVVVIENMKGVTMGEVLQAVETNAEILVLGVEENCVHAAVLRTPDAVKTGDRVQRFLPNLSMVSGTEVLGRVLSPLGDALDGRPRISTTVLEPVEQSAPGVIDRESVSEPLATGILVVDALVPIGRGQRELIIGDRQTGKTTIAIDAIINQKGKDVLCVYVAIGQRDSKTAQVIKTLTENGAMEYTTIISSSAAEPAAVHYLAPYSGVALAEHFMRQGKHVLVVFDDLSKHAVAYRELSLLLRKPPGREAYPGDVFYIHSRLLERAAKLSKEHGGGSITALPIVETLAGDVSAYIPTNVISITDGQIFLEPKLFYRGIRPAVNVGISVSRVGGAAQTHIMKKVAGSVKLSLAQYYELAAFSQFASELDEDSKRQLLRGERLVEVLKQPAGKPYTLWQEVLILFVTTKGLFDTVEVKNIQGLLGILVELAQARFSGLITEIETEKKLSDSVQKQLEELSVAFAELIKEKYAISN
ncbi:MAG: F0F1 ATP synthase subunit alpha [Candidatus Pacebacteria bacterium]|jgi:F-type H+-transporting ATPase subunit alpha|nr:F0F1 ATP synthase subunit alpha [Candidatus Paceibacterota bacterium]